MARPKSVPHRSGDPAQHEWSLGGVGRMRRPTPSATAEAPPPPQGRGWRAAFAKYRQLPRQRDPDRFITEEPYADGGGVPERMIAAIEPGRARWDNPVVDRRMHPMPPPYFPNEVRRSLGGTGLLATLNPSVPGWRRRIATDATPRTWGYGLKRFYWGPGDARSAPLVGRRVRVPQAQQRPYPRLKFALPWWRVVPKYRTLEP